MHGAVTLHTSKPLSTSQLLPVLQTLLAQNGATLVESDGIYRVMAAGATAAPAGPQAQGPGPPAPAGAPVLLATEGAATGAVLVPLRYAAADELAKVLQPFAGGNARIVADPWRNALLISAEPAVRSTLVDLVRAFDIDLLAGQSYALLPVTSGDAKDFASVLQKSVI